MNRDSEQPSELERRLSAVLEESVARTDAHVRSRLNRARQAALEEASTARKARWRLRGLMPAAGAIAATLVLAIVIWGRGPERALPTEGGQAVFEDFDLIADDEALSLVEEGDRAFYEWAVSQGDAGGGAST